jgi:hypothetical protein
MSAPENPAAFPSLDAQAFQTATVDPGMSLRDWFAGQALAGDFASQSEEIGEFRNGLPDEEIAARVETFYRFADAMLAERAKVSK